MYSRVRWTVLCNSSSKSVLHALRQVSALLGRIPSAVGYQPTLSTDLGGLQERITTTTKGSITSVQVCMQYRIHQSSGQFVWLVHEQLHAK